MKTKHIFLTFVGGGDKIADILYKPLTSFFLRAGVRKVFQGVNGVVT